MKPRFAEGNKMPHCQEGYSRGALEREIDDATMRSAARKDEYPHKIMRQRVSTAESSSSSRASFTSSSRSSSLSSPLEQGSPVKTIFSTNREAQNSSTEGNKTAQVSDIFLASGIGTMKQCKLADVMNSPLKESHGEVFRSSSAINRTSKFQDFPRLPLGFKGTDRNSKSTEKEDYVRLDENIRDARGSQLRVPSVVAKLMGLETLPPESAVSSEETNVGPCYEVNDVRIPSSAKNPWKERNSPPWKIHDCPTKPMALFPIEPAPWKNVEKARIRQKMAPVRVPYCEIEKRLKELEFLVSGKNLGAVKQMIEAVEVMGIPENSREGDGSNEDEIGSSTNDEPPIKITKPEAKCVDGSNESPIDDRNCSGTTGKKAIFGNGKGVLTVNSVRTKLHQGSKDRNTGPGEKSSGYTISPRMQQRKLDSIKPKTQPTKKQSVPKSSSVGRRILKNFQTEEKPSESSFDSSNSGSREIQDTAQSRDGSTVKSRRSSSTVGVHQSPYVDLSESLPSGSVKKKSNPMLEEELPENVAYSSPVSVLDSINKEKDSLPSPKQYLRKITGGMSKIKDENSVLVRESSENSLVSTSSYRGSSHEIIRKKLKDIEGLIRKLRSLNSDHDEARVDYIASLCENSNLEHRYVSEILLSSGLLLRDFTSGATGYQFHSSGYPLNPQLFLVLERIKASSFSNQECPDKKKGQLVADKVHRKLIFDTVNEILARKLAFDGSSFNSWTSPLKLTRSSLTARKLVGEMCSEVEELRERSTKCGSEEDDPKWKTILFDDVMRHSESWANFDTAISAAVLDIERLIFKDLVKEIIVGG